MKEIKIDILKSVVTIVPEVDVEDFGHFNAFDVKVTCNPPFHGSDKELMNAVCKALSEQTGGNVELKTFYVVRDVRFVSEFFIEDITFQVITPLEQQWHC